MNFGEENDQFETESCMTVNTYKSKNHKWEERKH